MFYIADKPIDERYTITKQVSSITHMHVRSVIACFYYLEFARHLLRVDDLKYIYNQLKVEVSDFLNIKGINKDEQKLFDSLLKGNIYELSEDQIKSSGYVIHTLEASIWCLMTTKNYKDAVLKAVNLGEDTDTTAAVTGGPAGLLYGTDSIPESWLDVLARQDDIKELAVKFDKGLLIQRADFIATVQYKITEEGGRQTPAKSGYRPQIHFGFDEMSTTGIQIFIDQDIVSPGETVDAAIKMLSPQIFESKLSIGMNFELKEGHNIIGTSIITELLNSKLLKQ